MTLPFMKAGIFSGSLDNRMRSLESHEEQRKAEHDRRVTSDRRVETRRTDDRNIIAHARRMAQLRTLLLIFLVLVLPILLIRTGLVTSPSWLPLWLLYPEMLIQSLVPTFDS